jgi:hypothetical protein
LDSIIASKVQQQS